jgi:membrane-associated protease RseP (regulator of RpoE activity)
VGIFITALNLIPIGQLDGGHILYALLRKRAHLVAMTLLIGAVVGVVVFGYVGWTLMILLLFIIGPRHPPTADDTVPLGLGRTCLGWLSLTFVVVGFTPNPFQLP